MSIRHNGNIIAGASQYHPDLFDFKWADHELNDIQWLRGDTFSWQSGAVYQVAYQHLADDIDGKTLQSETVAGTTIQFYLADDGHKICPESEESNVMAIYNATGVAWYYIIDTVNKRFKLPRTKWGMTGLRGNVGDYVEAGLPNITGGIDLTGISNHTTSTYNENDVADSALYNNESITAGRYHTDSSNANGYNRIKFDASRSNSIYGNSDTVQPKATEMYLYFYVGNFTQTALENTAGLNASLFNGKADLDFGNTNMIDYVVEKQDPTALNNYTWYRKYKSGWVEQGGYTSMTDAAMTINLPIEMSNTNYCLLMFQEKSGDGQNVPGLTAKTTTSFSINPSNTANGSWQVSGMAA